MGLEACCNPMATPPGFKRTVRVPGTRTVPDDVMIFSRIEEHPSFDTAMADEGIDTYLTSPVQYRTISVSSPSITQNNVKPPT